MAAPHLQLTGNSSEHDGGIAILFSWRCSVSRPLALGCYLGVTFGSVFILALADSGLGYRRSVCEPLGNLDSIRNCCRIGLYRRQWDRLLIIQVAWDVW